MLILALYCTHYAPTPFLYTLHSSQVMLWGLKRAMSGYLVISNLFLPDCPLQQHLFTWKASVESQRWCTCHHLWLSTLTKGFQSFSYNYKLICSIVNCSYWFAEAAIKWEVLLLSFSWFCLLLAPNYGTLGGSSMLLQVIVYPLNIT